GEAANVALIAWPRLRRRPDHGSKLEASERLGHRSRMPSMIAAARALVRGARRRIGALRAKRPIRYRPDFTDSTFLASLDLPGEPGLAADFVRPEERERIRARVVAHFVEREAPRFFVDIARVSEIAATLRRDRPDWVQSLR